MNALKGLHVDLLCFSHWALLCPQGLYLALAFVVTWFYVVSKAHQLNVEKADNWCPLPLPTTFRFPCPAAIALCVLSTVCVFLQMCKVLHITMALQMPWIHWRSLSTDGRFTFLCSEKQNFFDSFTWMALFHKILVLFTKNITLNWEWW